MFGLIVFRLGICIQDIGLGLGIEELGFRVSLYLGFPSAKNGTSKGLAYPRNPGAHIVGPWVTDSIKLYWDSRTGTQYIGNWASRVMLSYSVKRSIWSSNLGRHMIPNSQKEPGIALRENAGLQP